MPTNQQQWTLKEVKELDEINDMLRSEDIYDRDLGKVLMRDFIKVHGQTKCDAIADYLLKRGLAA